MVSATTNGLNGAAIFAGWWHNVEARTPPVFYPVAEAGEELAKLEVGPGRVVLIGGPPGVGKTGLTMQLVVDCLRLTPDLRAVIGNVEMPATALLERQLARLSGVPLDLIRHRKMDKQHQERIDTARVALETVAERVHFLSPPIDMDGVQEAVAQFGANLVVVTDYIQRIAGSAVSGDRRGAIDAAMGRLRLLADAGAAVLVVATLARAKDRTGRTGYGADGLSVASFKESGELEYGCNDGYLLLPARSGTVTLRHVKSRYSQPRDLSLSFNGRVQSFTSPKDGGA